MEEKKHKSKNVNKSSARQILSWKEMQKTKKATKLQRLLKFKEFLNKSQIKKTKRKTKKTKKFKFKEIIQRLNIVSKLKNIFKSILDIFRNPKQAYQIIKFKINSWPKRKRIITFSLSSTLAAITIVMVIFQFILSTSTSQGATYIFNQTSWTGGATANTATHPTNETNWTEYSAKDSTVAAAAGGVSLTEILPSMPGAITDNGAVQGSLTALSPANIAAEINQQGITISPDGTSVYVTNYGSATVSMYSRNTSTGALTALSPATIATGTNPRGITISADGNSVYVTNYGSATVSMYSRNTSTGALTALSPATIATGTNPRGITISADGASVYVTNASVNTVSMYSRNTSTGALTALSPATIASSASPVSITISTDGKSVYVTNDSSNTVSMYSRNASTGALTALSPATIATGTNPQGITISPDGNSVYVTNYGSATVSMYSRNTSTGALTALSPATIASSASPVSITISTDGKSVYVTNDSSNTVSMYSRNASTGALTAFSPATIGAGITPYGITISADGTSVYVTNNNGFFGNLYMYSRINSPGFRAGTLSSTAISGTGSNAIVELGQGQTFNYTGSIASWTVPAGITNIEITANGAGAGGAGGSSNGKLAVTPGQTYYYAIGGKNSGATGGYGSGGNGAAGGYGGGGMTWFSTYSTYAGGTPIMVAGGAGGAGHAYAGGAGGGTGDTGVGSIFGYGGAGGGAGGAGGAAGGGCASGSPGNNHIGIIGGAGGAGYGGTGGGGGGGGYVGGGGGGGGGGISIYGCGAAGGGGGGGGSGYVSSSLSNATTTNGTGALSGVNGSLYIISFVSPGTFTSGVIDTIAQSAFSTLSYSATLNGQTLTINARAGNTATPDGTWTDWTGAIASGGSIASLSGNRYIQYRANLATTDTAVTPTLSSVTVNYTKLPQYNTSGTLTSSIYDSSSDANSMGDMRWVASGTSASETVKFQIRSASTSGGIAASAWCGPADTSSPCSGTSYFITNTGSTIPSNSPLTTGGDDRYFQYKVTLASGGSATPTLTSSSVSYVVNAPPDFDTAYGTNGVNVSQISNSGDPNWGKIKIQYSIRDIDTTTGSFTQNYVTPTFEYTLNGTDYLDVDLARIDFDATPPTNGGYGEYMDKTTNKVLEDNYLTYTAYWDAQAQISGNYSDTFKIRVTVNDNEGANNTANVVCDPTTLDTKAPLEGIHPILIDGSAATNNVTLSFTDNFAFQMKVGLEDDLHDVTDWETYAGTKTVNLITNPDTVYAEFRDAYGNTSSIYSVATPQYPRAMMVQDTSNVNPPDPTEPRLFIAWKVADAPPAGFNRYEIFKAEDEDGPWIHDTDEIPDITSRTLNYYGDGEVDTTTNYYYKTRVVDDDGNISYFSDTVWGIANGIQDGGEGGGGTDGTPPIIEDVEVNEDYINTTSAVITWNTNEVSDSFVGYSETPGPDSFAENVRGSATMADRESGIGEHRVVLTNLDPNTDYYFQVTSEDPAGNDATDSNLEEEPSGIGYTFKTKSGPAISNIVIKEVYNEQVTISWRTTTDSNTFVTYATSLDDNGLMEDPIQVGDPLRVGGDAPYVHEWTLTGLTEDTKYYFSVKSVEGDNDGDEALDDNGGEFYEFYTDLDETDPYIDENVIDEPVISYDKAIIYWTTDEPASSQVEYAKVSGGPYTATTEVSLMNREHYMVIPNLESDTEYFYKVMSHDINGNATMSEEHSFITYPDPEFQHAPLASIIAIYTNPDTQEEEEIDLSDSNSIEKFKPSILTDNTAILKFDTFDTEDEYVNSQCQIKYRKDTMAYSDITFVLENDFNANHSMSIESLISSTKYFFYIECTDNLGNAVTSKDFYFTTREKLYTEGEANGLTDSTAPTISNVSSGTITGESVTVTWDTDEKSNSLVNYGIESGTYENTGGDYLVNSDSANYVTNHTVIINNLTPSTEYYFKVISVDTSGNIGESSEDSFTTESNSSLSSINIVSTSLGEVTVSWSTSKKMTSIVEYGLTDTYGQSKTDSTMASDHETKISGLTIGSIYHFMVKGKDADNNIYSSSDYSFKPKSPPKVNGITVSEIAEHTAKISINTDIPADALITYFEKGNDTNAGSQGKPDFATKHDINLANLKSGTTYSYAVKVSDEQGNQTTSDPKEFTTDQDVTPPIIDSVHTDNALAQSDKVQTIISCKTNEPATASVFYKEGRNGEEKELKMTTNLTTSQVAVITSFKTGTVYNFKIVATDANGNSSTSEVFSLLTPIQKANVIQVIVNNFQDIFGWMKK